ncbi:glycosyltransferase family 4 protein [Thermospira aquatica]|uniref:Glycosyltransferase family 4 protein n=1 Tax=Thermospira aquatica TaxID=2828656 RepID=A0AAX3BE15_9SPIR|nr:glycosyltransferase family 1 protein [Thermospira aquatica]URA10345.1 glycosyltransferase family 4 protein [Thermospira aquatica]
MKRIVIDARMIQMSGIGRYIRSVLPAVMNLSDVEIILMGNPHELLPYTENIIPLRSRIYHPREQGELARKIPPCDLFWSPHFNVPITKIKAKKRLVTIHDVFHITSIAPYNWLEKTYARYLIQQAIKLSDAVIVVSEFTRDEIDFYLHPSPKDKAKFHTIYHFVEMPQDLVSPEERKDILSRYGIRPPFILYVGNIKPHKNIEGLIRAFAIVSRLHKELSLVVVGNKDNFYKGLPELEKIITEHHTSDRILFTGSVKDRELVTFYQEAIALVLPSFYEGFGLPPLEAMSVGCPVIVSYIPVFWEILENSAYYVNPYSYEDIAQKIYTMVCDNELQETYRQRGKERAALFTKDKTISEHLSLINSLFMG